MTVSAAQAAAFFDEIVANDAVWTICDDAGFPAPKTASGERSMPFWSLESRARKIIDQVSAYHGFQPHRLELDEFLGQWLSGLEEDGLRVGLNWSGKRATGYDYTPAEVRARILR